MSANFLRGVIQMRAECVQGEGGGQKRPKNCVRTLCMAPYLLSKSCVLILPPFPENGYPMHIRVDRLFSVEFHSFFGAN